MSRIFEALQHSSQTVSGGNEYARHFMGFYDFGNTDEPLDDAPLIAEDRSQFKSVPGTSVTENAVLDLDFEALINAPAVITSRTEDLLSDGLQADELLQTNSPSVSAPVHTAALLTTSSATSVSLSSGALPGSILTGQLPPTAEMFAPAVAEAVLPEKIATETAFPASPSARPASVVPEMEQIAEAATASVNAEFMALREALIAVDAVTPLQTLMICGVSSGDGASFVAHHLSECMAGIPSLTISRFEISGSSSVRSQHIQDTANYSLALQRTAIANLREVTIAQPGTSLPDLMKHCNVSAMMDILKNRFDLTLIDAPAVNDCAATAILAGMADGVILVAQHNATRMAALQQARETLLRAGARLLGVVINRR